MIKLTHTKLNSITIFRTLLLPPSVLNVKENTLNQTHHGTVYLFIAGMSNKKTANMGLLGKFGSSNLSGITKSEILGAGQECPDSYLNLEFCHQGDSVGIAQFMAEEGIVHQEAEG